MTARQQKALQALLTCPTRAAAAEAAGIGVSTLRGYMKDPDFMNEYRAACAAQLEEAANVGRQSMTEALDVMRDIMQNGAQEQNRLTAAAKVLDYTLRIHEAADVMAQLAELEKWKAEVEGDAKH